MDTTPLRISVVMAVYNGAEVLPRQLDALACQQVDFPWELVLADNRSTDGTADLVRRRAEDFPVPIRLVDAFERQGVPYARNVGVAAAQADLIMFCDQDDVVEAGWLAAAASALADHSAIMGRIQAMTPDGGVGRLMNPSIHTDRPVVESCNFGIRREVLEAVGGFDEQLPAYGLDDSELALRLRKAGVSISPVPDMVIRARQTVGVKFRIRKVFSSGRAEILVWDKHDDMFGDQLTWAHMAREGAHNVGATTRLLTRRSGAPTKEKLARSWVTWAAHMYELRRLRRG